MTPQYFDSITEVPDRLRGGVVLAASHGGAYVAHVALRLGLGGVIVSDAGVGRERAGIAGLDVLEAHHVPAAAVSVHSARIGDGTDCLARGLISFANRIALDSGIRAGMPAREALQLMSTWRTRPTGAPLAHLDECRKRLPGNDGIDIVLADSNSLIGRDDEGAIAITGSHGALLGGRPESAVRWPVLAAIYSDAGIGIDRAGITRLAALDARGIAAATVSVWSARIGDAQSTLDEGFITAANACATALGAEIGISCKELTNRLIAARLRPARTRASR